MPRAPVGGRDGAAPSAPSRCSPRLHRRQDGPDSGLSGPSGSPASRFRTPTNPGSAAEEPPPHFSGRAGVQSPAPTACTSPASNSTRPFPSISTIDGGHRLVDRMPINPKRMVFESSQERFVVPLRPEDREASKDFVSGPSHSHITHSEPPPVTDMQLNTSCRCRRKRKPSTILDSVPEGPNVDNEAEVPIQRKKYKRRVPNLNVHCCPADVIFTIQLLTPQQRASIVALGFGDLLKIVTESIDSWDLLLWLMDRVNPDDMKLRIGPDKVLPITPEVISKLIWQAM